MDPIIYRASELGGCVKALVAKRLGYEPAEAPATFTTLFAEGNLHEEAVLGTLLSDDYEVEDRQLELNIHLEGLDVIVQGHIDGKIKGGGHPQWRVLEVKSMGQNAWDMFKAYRWDTEGLIQKYKWQLSCYMIAADMEALVVIKNRNTGELRFEGVEVPFYNFEQIKERVLECERWARSDTLPTECSIVQFPCPYFYLHTEEEEEVQGDGVEIDAVAMVEATDRYLAARNDVDTAEASLRTARQDVINLLQSRDRFKTDSVSVTLYDYTTRTLDKKRMREDGIDVSKYEKSTTNKRLRVVPRRDGEDGEEVS